METKIKKQIKDFFKLLEIEEDFTIDVTEDEIKVSVSSEDPGILIGYHGETLESLQLILSLYVAKKLGEFKRVTLEIGDYRKNREEWLKRLAFDAKEKALSEGRELKISDLKAWERRVVHMELADDKEVISESEGEGRERSLVVRPK
jgi:spoIIIJ-associated protein